MYKCLAVDVWDQRQIKRQFIERLVSEKFDEIFIFTQNEWEYFLLFDELVPPLLNYFLEHSGTNINVITSLVNPLPNDPGHKGYNLKFWSTYWLYKTYGILKRPHLIDERQEQRSKARGLKHHYIMMNNRCHYFRCTLIDKLAERGLIEYGAVSWNNTDRFLMKGYEFKHFHGNNLILDEKYNKGGGQYSVPDQYFESFIQLISESTPDHLFFSEKISIALVTGQPFIAAGGVGLHSYLRDSLGFKLYDEIFDYSFDNEPDTDIRWNMIVDNIQNISKYSLAELEDLKLKMKDKIIFNQLRAKQIVLDNNFIPDIIKKCLEWYKDGHHVHGNLRHVFDSMELSLLTPPELELI